MSNIPSNLTPLQKRYLSLQIRKNNIERLNQIGFKKYSSVNQEDESDYNKMQQVLNNVAVRDNNQKNSVVNMQNHLETQMENTKNEKPSKVDTTNDGIERINDKIETYNLRYNTRFKQMSKTFDDHKEILNEY